MVQALALDLGAETVLHPDDGVDAVRDACHGELPRVVIECSGAAAAQRLAIDAVARRGTVAFVGNSYHETVIRVSQDLIFRGISLIGCWHYNTGSTGRLFEQIAAHPDLSRRLITHRFPLHAIGEAWTLQRGRDCGKVIIRP
ncbi:zinc-binding dehydrogenase [Phytohabitans sp. ZYX-F-186]|uniref:Zinc-binding dehydrogenase n=1 Tax=Phytohabitans maris TaxID=3071409 RepID=A0ABU0ZWS9_9ACTN|nr:zinc-binding dehydrogenase [Phytohabitans sp. ZYX-F-186]MDQ7911491.1 zinc-binding dehydrogenase [Phytohabitans sp. ZYX-F-186]